MSDRAQGETAPYALVRLAALPHPDGAAAAAPFRRAVEKLAAVEASRMDERAALTEEIELCLPDALAAEREVLASLCGTESLRRAAVFSDLPHADAESTALRHALGATSKTGPLSWYGWATWSPDAPDPAWDTPVAVTRVNQVLLTRLIAALVADRSRLFDHPHRLAPDVHADDGQLRFRRDVPAQGPLHATVGIEEDVELASSPPVQFLVGLTGANPKGISPAELASALATRLPDGETDRAQHYVALLLDIKLLVPVLPVDPQDPAACPALASWLRDTGRPELADRVVALYRDTVAFAGLDARDRPAALTALVAAWEELGSLVGADLGGVTPLSEDVVLPQAVRLGRAHGYNGARSLAALTPLLMLFDRHLAIRRHSRDLFVTEFGHGGSARLAACAPLLHEAMSGAPPTGGLGASRAQVADLVQDGVITDEVLTAAADLLPTWMKTRPVSYSFFAQPSPDGLVVNHIQGGFGRFPCRFLDLLPPDAYATVRATLDGVFPRGFAEYRPVQGFNPNLHPLLGRAEIGEDPRWADHTPDSLELFHDQERDELRLRRRDTGAVIDVLYLGYLMPISLPDRVAALHADLACGAADLSPLQPVVESGGVRVADRLRYRDVVLGRRFWDFEASALQDAFADPVGVTRLRAAHGMPAQLFAGAGPEPQYVDLTNALHLHCLPELLSRYPGRLLLTEALPVPSGQVLEVIAETYRRAG